MAKCPKCETNVETPVKEWSLPRKSAKAGDKAKMNIGLFECPKCKTQFRATVEKPTEPASIKSVVKSLKDLEGEFVNTLKNLREKIQKLEGERSNLILEIDELKKMAESKASALESEITMLREEVKSLKDLLGYEKEEE